MTKDEEIAKLKQSLAMAKQKKTLRDEFAMVALPTVMQKGDYLTKEMCAKASYLFADFMMQERHK